jgi:membrane protein implicated in regulation of membrane protease activity
MKILLMALGVIGLVFLLAVFGGTIVYFLWPVVMVPVFHLPELTWFQAVALTYICAILLKSSSTSNSNKD